MVSQIITFFIAVVALMGIGQLPLPARYLPASPSGGSGGGAHLAAPIISNLKVVTMHDSATVTWTTNMAANAKVEYWIDVITGDAVFDRKFVTSHIITLTGLTASTTYTFNVASANEDYWTSSIPNQKFTTKGIPSVALPSATISPPTVATTTIVLPPPPAATIAPTPTAATPATPSTVSGKVTFLRTLTRGSRGEDVRYLQQILIASKLLPAGFGYDSGFFGTATQSALKRLQQRFGLDPTGTTESKTRDLLNKM